MPVFKIDGVWQTLSGEETIDRLIGSRFGGLDMARLDSLVAGYLARISRSGETAPAPGASQSPPPKDGGVSKALALE
jgi:hypothetical protein